MSNLQEMSVVSLDLSRSYLRRRPPADTEFHLQIRPRSFNVVDLVHYLNVVGLLSTKAYAAVRAASVSGIQVRFIVFDNDSISLK